MSSQPTENHRENAEIFTDPTICKQKFLEILEQLNMAKGFFPLDDLIEFGHNKQNGFIWLKHKKPKEKKFKKIGKLVCFGTEVTGFIENRRMHKLTGVKYKEFMISIAVTDISIKDPQCKEMTFTIANGFSVGFPVSAFED